MITNQEAIKRLKEARSTIQPYGYVNKALDRAIEALEKQTAKKPSIEGDGYLVYDTWICPNCEERYEIGYDDYKYCPNCGQKLDMEGVEKMTCNRYAGVSCIDESCPKAMEDELHEIGCDVPKNCKECPYYKGCKDCAWYGTKNCVEGGKNE